MEECSVFLDIEMTELSLLFRKTLLWFTTSLGVVEFSLISAMANFGCSDDFFPGIDTVVSLVCTVLRLEAT